MKNLQLTTWDRIQLLQCIPPQGTISDIRKHLRLVEVLELTEEEKELVGWVETRTMTPQGPATSTAWAGENAEVGVDYEFAIDLEDADFKHLKALMAGRKDWTVSPLTIILHDKMEKVGNEV